MLTVCAARLGHLLSEHDRRDLAQAVTLAIWKKLDQYRGEAKLETWAYRFCFLEIRWFLRKTTQASLITEDVEAIQEPASKEERADPLEQEEVYRALAELDSEVAEVVSLKHFEGLVFTEIADRLGLSPNTAKTRYYRGISKLRTRLSSLIDGAMSKRRP